MFAPNADRILAALGPDDVVLDVGGWACPFNRAQWILDAEPFETRGFYRTMGWAPSQGGDTEWFSADRWVRRDICDRTPWPFADKQFDFAICSHTLEDIRDPLWVCSELIRVAKRGYLEVPSREWESSRGVEHPKLAGLSHHRWLIEIAGDRIAFLQKYHRIHTHWRLSLPPSHARNLPPERAVQWLWWEGSFTFHELTIHGLGGQDEELERFVRTVRPYARWQLTLDRWARGVNQFATRVRNRLARAVGVGKA